MKWIRTEDHIREYGNLYLDLRQYITIIHIKSDKHFIEDFAFVYVKNGERIYNGLVKANNWDKAQQLVLENIQNKLRANAAYWKMLSDDFSEKVNANETLG